MANNKQSIQKNTDSASGRMMRKTADNLAISGLAVIALGLWTSFRFAMLAYLHRDLFIEEIPSESNLSSTELFQGIIILVLVIILVGMLVDGYIGISARREASEKSHLPYLILTSAFLMMTIANTIDSSYLIFNQTKVSVTGASVLCDISQIYALCSVIYYARKLRKLKREKRVEETS